MGALKCTAHLLSLLCPLHFIINACIKCVTLTLIIINGNDHLRLFSNSSEPLVLMANFYRLPTAICSLVPVHYSLAILGVECLLWLRLSLISIRYALP